MLLLLPKKGLTVPGYKYCRPGNPLDLGKPTDEMCMNHDYCYSDGVPKRECDKEMLKDLGKSKSKSFDEKMQRI